MLLSRIYKKTRNKYYEGKVFFGKGLYKIGLKSHKDYVFPNFLCIGAQKAGTSWLYDNLRAHPDCFIPDNRYIHFFDRNFGTSLKKYSDNFIEGTDKIKGEVIPGYGLISIDRIEFIRKIMPDVQLIFIMRDPIERAWSHARMKLMSFENRTFDEVREEEFITQFNSNHSIRKGDYLTVLDKWKQVFPEERMLLCYNEEISKQPEELLNRVFKHVGLSTIEDFSKFPAYKRINAAPKTQEIPEKYRKELFRIYEQKLLLLSQRFGGYADGWKKKYSELKE